MTPKRKVSGCAGRALLPPIFPNHRSVLLHGVADHRYLFPARAMRVATKVPTISWAERLGVSDPANSLQPVAKNLTHPATSAGATSWDCSSTLMKIDWLRL